jgi:two-component system chemotaxis response regulator CheB
MAMMLKAELPLRVLAADDSAVVREALRMMFDLHAREADGRLPAMELCGVAGDGVEALAAVEELKPDVLLLDLEMPRLDGIGVLNQLRARGAKVAVILCCTHTERSARALLDALALGAKDYVMKPGREVDPLAAISVWMRQLLPKIAAAGSRQGGQDEAASAREGGVHSDAHGQGEAGGVRIDVVAIAISTGGPSALETMLPMLPADFAAPVLIVQHMPRLFTGALAERLKRLCRLPVMEAKGGETIRPGAIWLAPGDQHMEIAAGCGSRPHTIRLHGGPALNSCTPSADYLLRSAARVYGAGALGLVMTGMGADGVEGARAVRDAGGTVLAQDEATSAVWGMPGRTVRGGIAHATVPLQGLAGALVQRVRNEGATGQIRTEDCKEVSYGLL